MRKPRLQQELKQQKPFESLEEMVFLNILRTGDALLRGEAELLRRADLSFAQYNALRILRGAGESGLTCGEISERMVNHDPDITRLLDRLERRGFVLRARDKADRRAVVARITDEGKGLLKELDEPIVRTHRLQLKHMKKTQLQALMQLLELARTPGP